MSADPSHEASGHPCVVGWVDRKQPLVTSIVVEGGGQQPADSSMGRDLTFVRDRVGDSAAAWAILLPDGSSWPIPPQDNPLSDWRSLPELPGVDLRWVATYTGGAFADYYVTNEIRDGKPFEVVCHLLRPGEQVPTDSADVWFTIPLPRLLQHRLGEATTLDLVQPPGGSVDGDVDAMMLLAGLVDERWTAAAGMPEQSTRALLRLLQILDGRRLAEPPQP